MTCSHFLQFTFYLYILSCALADILGRRARPSYKKINTKDQSKDESENWKITVEWMKVAIKRLVLYRLSSRALDVSVNIAGFHNAVGLR